jgi:hypothetical protein
MYSRQLLSSVNFMPVPEQLYRSWTIDSCSPHQFDVLGSLDAMLLRMCRVNQEQDVVDLTYLKERFMLSMCIFSYSSGSRIACVTVDTSLNKFNMKSLIAA